MKTVIVSTLALILVTASTASFAEGKKNGFAEEETTYLGNSDNVAEDGQGGNGTHTETTTGPKGQVVNNDSDDCNNCDSGTTDHPGQSK